MLRDVIEPTGERLLVGPQTVDDAGVVVLGPGEGLAPGSRCALVQTVDYFPPVVDDPYAYGAIAAANSLSDVYAMGARPFSALNLAGFPKDFPDEWIRAILAGGFEKMHEAGALVVGGHTVQSNEAQFGFAVTGVVDPEHIVTNDGARAGDVLYLTKVIGMGTMTTAAMRGRIGAGELAPAAEQMARLNRGAAEAMVAAGAHACTDVTGFGLAGHAKNLACASAVTITIRLGEVPLFPGVLELAREGFCSGGSRRGREALSEAVEVEEGLDDARVALAFDAETSGGLLIAVAAEDAARLEDELARRDEPAHRIGECLPKSGCDVRFTA